MGRPFIVLGDQTDHGGVVIEASVMTDTHGKGIARVGDQVTCPKRGHGPTVIVTGETFMRFTIGFSSFLYMYSDLGKSTQILFWEIK